MDGSSGELWHDDHEATQNIIPTPIGAATAVGMVIPELNRELTGMAFRVPAHSVSVVGLTRHLEKGAKYDNITVVKQVSEGPLKGILGYTEDQANSCDFNREAHFPTSEAWAGIVLSENFIKLS